MFVSPCPSCGHTNFTVARICGGCGARLKTAALDRPPLAGRLGVFLLCVALCAVAAAGLYLMVRNAAPELSGILGR